VPVFYQNSVLNFVKVPSFTQKILPEHKEESIKRIVQKQQTVKSLKRFWQELEKVAQTFSSCNPFPSWPSRLAKRTLIPQLELNLTEQRPQALLQK